MAKERGTIVALRMPGVGLKVITIGIMSIHAPQFPLKVRVVTLAMEY